MEETRIYIFEQILEKYKLRAGYYIDQKWLISARTNAPILIQRHFDNVLQQMIDENFFECKEENGDTWFLTQKGEDLLYTYIAERNKKMNDNSSGINIQVNPIISQNFNQTNTQNSSNIMNQTQELNIQLMLQEQLGEETYKKLEEIIESSIPKEEKSNKLKTLFSNLSFGVMSNVLANLITTLPWS